MAVYRLINSAIGSRLRHILDYEVELAEHFLHFFELIRRQLRNDIRLKLTRRGNKHLALAHAERKQLDFRPSPTAFVLRYSPYQLAPLHAIRHARKRREIDGGKLGEVAKTEGAPLVKSNQHSPGLDRDIDCLQMAGKRLVQARHDTAHEIRQIALKIEHRESIPSFESARSLAQRCRRSPTCNCKSTMLS